MSGELVSIIIVNLDGADFIGTCLESVFAQDYHPFEVILVDNGSTDGSVANVQERFPKVRVVASVRNLGFAGGNNRGVEEAKGKFVVLLNNDTVVERGWLSALVEVAKQENVGAATSRVVTDGVPYEFYEMNGTVNYLGYNIMREFRDLSRVFFAGGASLIFSKDVVGRPFLDEYFLYQEDVFLSWRLQLQGKLVLMVQSSCVRHRGSITVRQQPSAQVTFYQERNRLLNALLFYEPRTLFILLPYFVCDAVVKIILSLVAGRKSFVGIMRAYFWLFTHFAWIRRERDRLQSSRVATDKTIMAWMSHKVVDNNSLPGRAVNALSKLYARFFGLAFHE